MKLLQVIILCLLLPSLYSSKENADGKNATIGGSPSISTTEKSVSTPSMTPNPVSESTTGISSNGTTNKESLSTPLPPTFSSLTTTIKDEGKKTEGVMKNPTTANPTVTSPPLSNTVSTPQSSQHKTENQSSTKTTETPGNTPHPETPPANASTLPSISVTIPGNISQFQGTEDAKNASSSSANPSYSSIILPVVIALIVVTLSAFILVGLYRMCRKTDPGTPENGNDQPQSDKESVKLLTVKTISHEPGEHSAQGKTKN